MTDVKHSLCGSWTLSFTHPESNEIISTTVNIPCNVEPTLEKLGLVKDYMPSDTPFALSKFEWVDDWTYTTTFKNENFRDDTVKTLVFEGVDTIGEVYLNGEKILDCMDMHLAYKYDVTNKLKEENELKVIIRSINLWAQKHPHDMYSLTRTQYGMYDSQPNIRKARYMWGWDNAPRLLTSGIFRPVYIEELEKERFDDVYISTLKMDENNVFVRINYSYTSQGAKTVGDKMVLTVYDGDTVIQQDTADLFFTQGTVVLVIPRNKVSLWWPRGFGEAKLYRINLEIVRDGKAVCNYSEKVGFRTIKLQKTEYVDDNGNGEFVFVVNGERVYIRGTNHKPFHALPSLADELTRDGRALQEIVNLNCNMVRVWGGGIYEDDAFFNFCDENGIMVWQDFMFGCEIDSLEAWYCELVSKEAEYIIKKYRNHPGLALWCGDNENDECVGWNHSYDNVLPGDCTVSRQILKKAVLRFDPARDYVESSPYITDTTYLQRKGSIVTQHPTEMHMYLNMLTCAEKLRESKEIFIGETGPIEVNSFTLDEEIFEKERPRLERMWDWEKPAGCGDMHQNDGYMSKLIVNGKWLCNHFFGEKFDISEWRNHAFAINLLSAELFKDIVEYCRVSRWSKSGVIWWSLMDMWPMICNYSVIDSKFNKKLAYHWLKQSQQDIIFAGVCKKLGEETVLYGINDTLSDVQAEYTVVSYDANMCQRIIAKGTADICKNSVLAVQTLEFPNDSLFAVIKWKTDGKGYANHIMTKKYSSLEVSKEIVRLIAKHCGFESEVFELEK